MYAAKLNPPRHHNRRPRSGETTLALPNQVVQRRIPKRIKPAQRKRELPVQIGGQNPTIYFVPVLLPPHKKTANTRLSASNAFWFRADILSAGIRTDPRRIVIGEHVQAALVLAVFGRGD